MKIILSCNTLFSFKACPKPAKPCICVHNAKCKKNNILQQVSLLVNKQIPIKIMTLIKKKQNLKREKAVFWAKQLVFT